ncbi:capsid staple protein [Paraburkholderia sediminicola]|uniref:capsid staple protein n=1 Tax=Paraburkholderia sediminicola TaxID=458836 RepID=UPI0038B7D2CD
MKLVNMERTAAEKKAAEERWTVESETGPDYPYGLCISLGGDEMEKLGIKELPDIGTELNLTAVVKVTSISKSESEKGPGYKSVSLQIVEMALDDDNGPSAADKLYGNK